MSFLIHEEIVEINNPNIFKWADVCCSIKEKVQEIKNVKSEIVKLNLVKSTKSKLYFHVIYLENFKSFVDEPFLPNVGATFKVASTNEISCLIIPTGVGALFGGYAGDANPLAKLFASKSKYLLTHPNVVNGAVLTDIPENLIYLEGYLLDQFLIGKINLIPSKKNKIGVIFDKGISEKRLQYELNVLNATRAFYGCEIKAWTLTEKPLLIEPEINSFGFSSGKIKNLEYVIDKALALKKIGVDSIAICCAISDSELNSSYILGKGIDPIGGIESIISHVVSASCGLVSAHAPVLISDEKIDYKKISPVSSSEYIAKTFLPSVISGLRFAPKIVKPEQNISLKEQNTFSDISNLIVPYNAFGSAGVFFLNEQLSNVFLVKENKTCLSINPNDLNVSFKLVDKYFDLFSMEEINNQNIDLNVLKRPIGKISEI